MRDARHLLRGGRIDALVPGVRMRAREELHVQHVAEPDAAGVLRFTGEPRDRDFRQSRQRLPQHVEILWRVALPFLCDHLAAAALDHLTSGQMASACGVIPDHRHLDVNNRCRLGVDPPLVSSQHRGGIHHGPDHRRVGRAPADVPGQRGLHLILRRVRVLVEKPFRGDHPARRTESAIRRHVRVPNPLERMQILLVTHAFDGENLLPNGFGRQGVAGVNGNPVHQHAARAAGGAIATPVGSRQARLHRDHFPQRRPRLIFG